MVSNQHCTDTLLFEEILLALTQIASEHNDAAAEKLHGSDIAAFCLHQGKAYGVQDAMDAVKEIQTRYQGVRA
jgi:hypothetical protein